jgi:hypothetical protein
VRWIRSASVLCGALVIAFAAVSSSAATPPVRDWSRYPAVVLASAPGDILAVGDAHGDPRRLAAALAGAGLINDPKASPASVRWTAGRAVLVITGDLIDKGPDSLGVIALVRAVQADAQSKGGRVIVTLGNHEGEFLGDPTGKKTSDFSDALTKAGLQPARVAACEGDIGAFLCTLPAAARIGDWFFSHAGNTSGRSVETLERDIEAGYARDGYRTDQLLGDNSILEARLNKQGPAGLPWFDLGDAKTDPRTVLARYAQSLGVAHIVQGHQPGDVKFPDGEKRKAFHFYQRYGSLFLIDTGMSRGIDGSDSLGGALRITGSGADQKAVVVCPDGSTKTLWGPSKSESGSHHCGA